MGLFYIFAVLLVLTAGLGWINHRYLRLNALLFVRIGLEVLVLTVRREYMVAGVLGVAVVLLSRLLATGLIIRLLRLLGSETRTGDECAAPSPRQRWPKVVTLSPKERAC